MERYPSLISYGSPGTWLRMNIIYFGGVLYNDIFMVSMNDNNAMKLLGLRGRL